MLQNVWFLLGRKVHCSFPHLQTCFLIATDAVIALNIPRVGLTKKQHISLVLQRNAVWGYFLIQIVKLRISAHLHPERPLIQNRSPQKYQ